MTEVDVTLLLGAILVAVLSWRHNRRGILWIGDAALSYVNASIAWRLHLPYAEGITGVGDAFVCFAVYFAGRERWEMLIWRLFQTSVAISFLYLAGNLGIFVRIPHESYSILMEAINWLTLLLIGGMSATQWAGGYDGSAHRTWGRVGRFSRFIQSERAQPHFLARKT